MFARLTIVLIHLVALSSVIECEQQPQNNNQRLQSAVTNGMHINISQHQAVAREGAKTSNQLAPTRLEARAVSEYSGFVKDIIDRLHSLDADIGKILFNSTSMYASDNEGIFKVGENQRDGDKFKEVLNDLDTLQDELGGMIINATRTRQYDMLVRLRPVNNILYRIRHNLQLMRNSLVAINAFSSLEKMDDSVLDSTLTNLVRPDAYRNDEPGDAGTYNLNLDQPQDLPSAGADRVQSAQSTTTTISSTTSRAQALERTSDTTQPSVRPPPRRSNNLQIQRRITAKPTLAPRTEAVADRPL